MLSVASDAVQRTRADMNVHRQRCAPEGRHMRVQTGTH